MNRIIVGILSTLLLISPIVAQKKKVNKPTIEEAEQTRWICKGTPIPKGYVVEREASGPECANGTLIIRGKGEVPSTILNSSTLKEGKPPVSTSGITSQFDRFENKTSVYMDSVLLYRKPHQGTSFEPEELSVSAAYAVRGQQLITPQHVTISFTVKDVFTGMNYADKAIFIADGMRYTFDRSSIDTSYNSKSVAGEYGVIRSYDIGTASITMPYGHFKKIVTSQVIEVRVGGKEFMLSGAPLYSLQNFVNYMSLSN